MPRNAPSSSADHEQKLQRLLAVAAEIFAEKGYHNASIRDLSRRAGVSLSGLYYYFGSKEELLYMIQQRSLQRMLDELEARLAEAGDPRERLRTLIHNHVAFFASHQAAMQVINHDYDALEGEYRQEVLRLRRRYTEKCTEILRDLRRVSGTGDVAPLNVATSALLGMMNGIYAWGSEASVSVDRLAEQLYRLFAGGFSGPVAATSR